MWVGLLVYVSPSISPEMRHFFFSQSKIKRVGRERREVAKSQVWGK